MSATPIVPIFDLCGTQMTLAKAQATARQKGRAWRAKKCPMGGDHWHVIATREPDQKRRRRAHTPIGA